MITIILYNYTTQNNLHVKYTKFYSNAFHSGNSRMKFFQLNFTEIFCNIISKNFLLNVVHLKL